jgi:hypothetical protein
MGSRQWDAANTSIFFCLDAGRIHRVKRSLVGDLSTISMVDDRPSSQIALPLLCQKDIFA